MKSHLAAAASGALVDALALCDVDLLLVLARCVAHALLDLPSHRQEGLLDIRGILGGCFKEGNAEAVSELLQLPLVFAAHVSVDIRLNLSQCTEEIIGY